jgi:hypothetical protein
MDKFYISFDIEASGPVPGKYTMLSLWACSLNNTDITFYDELKPTSSHLLHEATRVGSLGLRCLDAYKNTDPQCDPLHAEFKPTRVLEILSSHGREPTEVMDRYAQWVEDIVPKNSKPTEAAWPIRFDSMWTTYYFGNYGSIGNPFWPTGWLDMDSFYKWLVRNTQLHIANAIESNSLTHNALEDAQEQARIFNLVLQQVNMTL